MYNLNEYFVLILRKIRFKYEMDLKVDVAFLTKLAS